MGYREHSFRSLRPYRPQSEGNQGRKTSKAPTWLAPCLNGRHSCRSVERHLPARLFESMAWRAVGRLILKLPRYFLPDWPPSMRCAAEPVGLAHQAQKGSAAPVLRIFRSGAFPMWLWAAFILFIFFLVAL